eukprot:365041-Chlamydomonas_euryale.AAC.7
MIRNGAVVPAAAPIHCEVVPALWHSRPADGRAAIHARKEGVQRCAHGRPEELCRSSGNVVRNRAVVAVETCWMCDLFLKRRRSDPAYTISSVYKLCEELMQEVEGLKPVPGLDGALERNVLLYVHLFDVLLWRMAGPADGGVHGHAPCPLTDAAPMISADSCEFLLCDEPMPTLR